MKPNAKILPLIVTVAFTMLAAVRAPAAEMAMSQASVVGPDYRIGPGDVLRIFVLNNPDLGAEIPVRPDGRISTPLVADLVAVGKTPAELSKEFESRLSVMVRSPIVTVIVASAVSALSQIRVVGQAANPRAVPYRSGLGVLDVLIEVGGLSQYAAGNRAKILRTTDGKTREIRIRLSDLVNKGDITQNVPLAPGDVLVIPEARF